MKILNKSEMNIAKYELEFQDDLEFNKFKSKVDTVMNMYLTGSLYHALRFKYGIVHVGDFNILENNKIELSFTSKAEYLEEVDGIVQNYLSNI